MARPGVSMEHEQAGLLLLLLLEYIFAAMPADSKKFYVAAYKMGISVSLNRWMYMDSKCFSCPCRFCAFCLWFMVRSTEQLRSWAIHSRHQCPRLQQRRWVRQIYTYLCTKSCIIFEWNYSHNKSKILQAPERNYKTYLNFYFGINRQAQGKLLRSF